MGTSNYSDGFKRDAVQQIRVCGYPVREVAQRLGVSSQPLYKWMKLFAEPAPKVWPHGLRGREPAAEAGAGADDRVARHPKKGEPWIATGSRAMARVLRARVPMKYAFIRAHQAEFGVRAMCRVLRVHFCGFYAWLKEPLSRRVQDDVRQTELIRQAWSDSGKVYGYRKLTDDLRDLGEQVSENRVARLASLAGILPRLVTSAAQGDMAASLLCVASNTLDRQFEEDAPDRGLGDRHHLHQDPRGLAVSGGRHRSVLAAPCRTSRHHGRGRAQPRMTTDLACRHCSRQSGGANPRPR
jgi:hypothetical protein